MQGTLQGFGIIGLIIALGYLLAHVGVLGASSQQLLARLTFFVATPALLFGLLSTTDVAAVFGAHLAVTAGSVVVVAALYIPLARRRWRRRWAETVIGAMSSMYVNAGNLGLPIAVYVLGDISYVAPVLLVQLLAITPAALAVLDASQAGRRPSLPAVLASPLRNPITVACLLGLLVTLTGVSIPTVLAEPVELVGGMAVPGALLAYGVSLRCGPSLAASGLNAELAVVAAFKLLLQPAVAYLIGRYGFSLDGIDLLAVTVTSALPTAQNVFVYATRYERGEPLARDAVLVTTVLAVPVIVGLTFLAA